MEIEAATRRRLLSAGSVTGYVGQKVFTYALREAVGGTGGLAYVVRRDGGWATPNLGRHGEFPSLVVQCCADKERADDGEPVKDNEEERAWMLYRVLPPILHGVRDEVWGGPVRGLHVVRCESNGEPFVARPEGAEWCWVQSRWNVETFH